MNEALSVLRKEIPIPLVRSRLHFYDRIKLVRVRRRKDKLDSREYDEQALSDLKKCILLSFLGIDLVEIDKLINKNNPKALETIQEILKQKAKALRLIRRELRRSYANPRHN